MMQTRKSKKKSTNAGGAPITLNEISTEPANAAERISEYIANAKVRKTLFGVDERDVWTIVANIQKYYEKKAEEDAAVIASLREENELLAGVNAKQKLYIDAMGGLKK